MGHRVGALDLDLRQKSFGRYIENRRAYLARTGLNLATPDYRDLPEVSREALAPNENPFDQRLSAAIAELEPVSDFIIIDCPGSHTRLSQVAHSLADTLITPLNDSFIDFDLLARVDPETGEVKGPSIYSEMVWSARQLRAQAGLKPIDWIVLRNRLGAQQMHNKKKVGKALEDLSKRIGFRVAPGFSERVIFRELFPARPDPAGPQGYRGGSAEHLEHRGPAGSARPDERACTCRASPSTSEGLSGHGGACDEPLKVQRSPSMPNILFDALFVPLAGRQTPLLLLTDRPSLSGDAFLRLVARQANALRALGVGPGDRIAAQVAENARGAGRSMALPSHSGRSSCR